MTKQTDDNGGKAMDMDEYDKLQNKQKFGLVNV